MIRDHLRQPLVDPLSQHEKLEENIRRLQKKAKRGRFSRKKNLDSSEESDTEENEGPIDPALTQRIFDTYLESPNRREMLHSLHSGEILEPGQEELFLALEAFLRGRGKLRTFLAHIFSQFCWNGQIWQQVRFKNTVFPQKWAKNAGFTQEWAKKADFTIKREKIADFTKKCLELANFAKKRVKKWGK